MFHRSKHQRGIFPKSYVQLVESELSKNELTIKRSDIVKEITTVLDDWGDLFKQFYLTTHPNFQPIRRKIVEVIRLRSQILSGNLPVDEMKEVKLLASAEIDTGNSILGKLNTFVCLEFNFEFFFYLLKTGLDMVVRDEGGNILDINATSTTELYQHHVTAVDRIKKANVSESISYDENFNLIFSLTQNPYNKNRISKTMNKHSHNLLVTVHAFVCKFQEDSDLLLTLYDGDEMRAITENYVVKWGRLGLARDLDHFDNHRVLFTDLSGHDLNRNKVYLICYAVRVGSMDIKDADVRRTSFATAAALGTGSKKQTSQNSLSGGTAAGEQQMRRPFGVAAIDLTPIIRNPDDFKNNLDLPFILCEKENLDNTLKKLIANKDVGKIDSKLAVSVELLHGDIKQV